MSDTTAYIITRGFQEGKALTTSQRSSATFAEEPVVLGRVLRRGSRPMRISGADYRANESKLLHLEKAGSIKIQRPEKPLVMPKDTNCSKCGQLWIFADGEKPTGEYPCEQCGTPTVHDDPPPVPGAGDAPSSQEGTETAPTAVTAPPAEPPEVIVPPHPPSEDPAPPPPVEEPVLPVPSEPTAPEKPEEPVEQQTTKAKKNRRPQ